MNEKEQKLLDSWSRLLGNPEVSDSTFEKIEKNIQKKERERKLLESFENALLGIKPVKVIDHEPIKVIEQPAIQEILDLEEIKEIKEDTPVEESFVDARNSTTRQITQPVNTPVEKQPQLPDDFVSKSVEAISKSIDKIPADELPKDEVPPAFRKEMDLLKKSVLDLHQFASRISQMGGGGAGSIDELTLRTVLVTTDYTANKKDYYIGVNCPTACTITLPKTNKNGLQIIIKDESGNCSINNITVTAPAGSSIDNNTTVIMGINNMSLTFIYRSGWRII